MALRTARHDEDALEETHAINVTPFIDVMLVLLIIFMVAAPLATVDTAVDLPASSARPQPRQGDPVFVTLRADRSLRVNDTTVGADGLATALQPLTGGDTAQRIYLRADREVAYADLMQSMDALRAAGYLKVALVALEQPAP